ncbi:unnamed protein product, partial [Ectocarpus sp. 8 AP-2014]
MSNWGGVGGAWMMSRSLSGLRELDLDGNPCSRSRGYKHRVIRCCPRLRELDGEELGQLDRDLSDLFFEEQVRGSMVPDQGII